MRCGHCGATCAQVDNYCSRCGVQLRGTGLPVPRDTYTPVPWQGTAPVVAGGVAALAAGTLLQWGLRWLARRVLRSRPLLPALRQPKAADVAAPEDAPPAPPEGAVSEMVYYRKVVIRRM